MKNNKEYSKRIQRLHRAFKRKYPKTPKTSYDEPLDAIVYGLVSENITAAEAQSAMKKINEHFIDMNDLRVSRTDEIVEALGQETADSRKTAERIKKVLGTIFAEQHTISLKYIKKIGKRQARKKLERIEGISRFAVNYCVLTALQGHCMPLTSKMAAYLKNNEYVEPSADQLQIENFLTKQVRADNAREFYNCLRRASESGKVPAEKRKTVKAKKKTKTRKKKQKQERGKDR